jgi:membrane associated rhomboid family serine protease
MFLPLSDAPNPQRVPWMTYALIVANVAVFVLFNIPLGATPVNPLDPRLAAYVAAIREALPPGVSISEAVGQITAYDLFVFDHGFRPAAAQGIDLLTSMFMHGGFMHLFGNMLFLWIYGDNVEYRLGRLRYLLAYLATGAAATLFYTLLSPDATLPLVGASGAISGVLGFYFLWFPRNVVRVLVFLFPLLMRVFEIPARMVLGVYLVWDNIVPLIFTAGQGGGGVAHGAHIGGFLAGLGGAWVIDRVTTAAKPPEYASAPEISPAPSAIEAAIARGDMETAARAYFSAAEPDPLPAAATLALADWLATHGHDEAALIVYRRLIRDHGREPGAAEAQLGAGLVELRRGQLAPAYQHLRASLERDPAPATRARAIEALRAIAGQQKYVMPRYEGRMG